MTIEIKSPDVEALIRERMQAGSFQSPEDLLRAVLQPFPPETSSGSIAHLQRTDPKEWLRQLRAWSQSHDRTTPPLSIETLSRESIYPDRV